MLRLIKKEVTSWTYVWIFKKDLLFTLPKSFLVSRTWLNSFLSLWRKEIESAHVIQVLINHASNNVIAIRLLKQLYLLLLSILLSIIYIYVFKLIMINRMQEMPQIFWTSCVAHIIKSYGKSYYEDSKVHQVIE